MDLILEVLTVLVLLTFVSASLVGLDLLEDHVNFQVYFLVFLIH